MARRPTMTQEKLDALRADYEAWSPYDPESPSADEIAARHGITKNTMYTWRSRGWRLNGRPGDGQQGWKARDGTTSGEDLSAVVQYLTEELVKARIRIEQLENAQEPPTPEGAEGSRRQRL